MGVRSLNEQLHFIEINHIFYCEKTSGEPRNAFRQENTLYRKRFIGIPQKLCYPQGSNEKSNRKCFTTCFSFKESLQKKKYRAYFVSARQGVGGAPKIKIVFNSAIMCDLLNEKFSNLKNIQGLEGWGGRRFYNCLEKTKYAQFSFLQGFRRKDCK